jgi:hypothetical protein
MPDAGIRQLEVVTVVLSPVKIPGTSYNKFADTGKIADKVKKS